MKTLLLVIGLAALFVAASPTTAGTAATWTVCAAGCDFATIQAGVNAAAAGDTLNIFAETFVENVVADKDLTLQGAGAGQSIVDGAAAGSVLTVPAGVSVVVKDLTLTNGQAPAGGGVYNAGFLALFDSAITAGAADDGGAIYNAAAGVAIVRDSALVGNDAVLGGALNNEGLATIIRGDLNDNTAAVGGALYSHPGSILTVGASTINDNVATDGGGLFNMGLATVESSLFSGNSVGVVGGAGKGAGGNGARPHYFTGGAIYNTGALTVRTSTISANVAAGAGEGVGGGIANAGSLDIVESTIQDNMASKDGGGLWNIWALTVSASTLRGNTAAFWGGAIANFSELHLSNSTLAANTADFGGGLLNRRHATVINATLHGNIADFGGGLYSDEFATLHVVNTIVTASLSGGDCFFDGPITGGHNLVDDATCGFAAAPVTHLVPLLADNGGATATYALLPGSNAIDAGDAGACPPFDQRAVTRPLDGDGDGVDLCDIGAYEYEYQVLPPQSYLPLLAG